MSQHTARETQEDPEIRNVDESPTGVNENFERSNDKFESFDDKKNSSKSTKMGSTDSASSTHGGSTSCGLVSSIFPTSCRGRAESFARRLHRRLTSLGGETNSSDDDERSNVKKITETTWLQAQTSQITTTTPPCNSANSLTSSSLNDERSNDNESRQSSESDVYYDFDGDTEDRDKPGTVSPAEMANAEELAMIRVNSPRIMKNNHHEDCQCCSIARSSKLNYSNETECVFSSPIAGLSPDTENSETFYDPESSETEKLRMEKFYDPQATSESDGNSSCRGAITKIVKFTGRRRNDRDEDDEITNERKKDDSDSSCSSVNLEILVNARTTGIREFESSEESINGRSSPETTSLSHESLWSTFDDSTLSLQEEITSTTNFAILPTTLAKSHSDSEIIVNSTESIVAKDRDEVDRVEMKVSMEKKNEFSELFDVETKILSSIGCPRFDGPVEIAVDELSVAVDDDRSTRSISQDIPELIVLNAISSHEPIDDQPNLHSVQSSENEDTSIQTETLRLILDSADVEKKDENFVSNHEEEKSQNDEENNDDELEKEDETPERVRRCSSLKTGKTPPGTPGRKKIVRFADVLGLDLADVRTFLDEIPKIPNSAYSDLIYDQEFRKDSSPVNFWGTGPATFTTPLVAATMGQRTFVNPTRHDKILIPLFQQPGGLLNFLDVVRERNVCLENVVVQDPVTMCLQGTVRVRNLDFHKSVHVRYSLDCWKNFSDLQATYACNSCDGFSDKFTFALYCHTLKIGQRLEMAVRFQCKGAQYWDNNAGINYCFQCLPATPANPGSYLPITAPTNACSRSHEWSPTFY